MSRLLGTGSAVRALVRSPDSANLPGEVEVVRGDMSEPATLEACLVRVEAVFLEWPFLTAEAAPAVLPRSWMLSRDTHASSSTSPR